MFAVFKFGKSCFSIVGYFNTAWVRKPEKIVTAQCCIPYRKQIPGFPGTIAKYGICKCDRICHILLQQKLTPGADLIAYFKITEYDIHGAFFDNILRRFYITHYVKFGTVLCTAKKYLLVFFSEKSAHNDKLFHFCRNQFHTGQCADLICRRVQ